MQNLDIESPDPDEKVGTSGRNSTFSERWKSLLPKRWQRDRRGFSRLEDEDGSPEQAAFRPSGKYLVYKAITKTRLVASPFLEAICNPLKQHCSTLEWMGWQSQACI